MARHRSDPLARRPYTYIERADRGRMPQVILPSVPSKIRKHHASSGTVSVLSAMLDYSGRKYVQPPSVAIEQAKADKRLRQRYRNVLEYGMDDSWLRNKIRVIKAQSAE